MSIRAIKGSAHLRCLGTQADGSSILTTLPPLLCQGKGVCEWPAPAVWNSSFDLPDATDFSHGSLILHSCVLTYAPGLPFPCSCSLRTIPWLFSSKRYFLPSTSVWMTSDLYFSAQFPWVLLPLSVVISLLPLLPQDLLPPKKLSISTKSAPPPTPMFHWHPFLFSYWNFQTILECASNPSPYLCCCPSSQPSHLSWQTIASQ